MHNHKNLGLIYTIVGGIFLCLGISKFLIHFLLIGGGLILLNAGLRMQNKPSLLEYINGWLSSYDWH
jgi:hypothetical protein